MAGQPRNRAKEIALAVSRARDNLGAPLPPPRALPKHFKPWTDEQRAKAKLAQRENAAKRKLLGGRPTLEVASLADKAALLVLARDVKTLESKQASYEMQERSANRIAVLCRGRIPALVTNVAEGGGGALALASVLDEATRALLRSLRARLPRAASVGALSSAVPTASVMPVAALPASIHTMVGPQDTPSPPASSPTSTAPREPSAVSPPESAAPPAARALQEEGPASAASANRNVTLAPTSEDAPSPVPDEETPPLLPPAPAAALPSPSASEGDS